MKLTLSNIKDIYKAKQSSIETMELKGYEYLENLFVDSSGFGQDNEPALTPSQMETQLTRLLKKHGTIYAKITGVGAFQVNIGLFKKTGESISRVVGNNTIEINYPDRQAIRLHDTNVVTFKDGKITLDTGGWDTITTSKRMNEYTPSNMRVYRKNWEMFADYNGKTYPFKDNQVTIVEATQ